MLLFIKSVNLTLNEEIGTIIISGIEHNIYTDVNRLGTGFSRIQEDFKIMEDKFDKKFDTLIFDYNEILNRIYWQDFEQEEGKKEQVTINRPYALYIGLARPFLSVILPKIVFKDFLMFYDEYSYAINERIANLHTTSLNDIVLESENIPNFKELIQSELGNNEDYKEFKYLDFHYFRNKLETKLSTVFGNTVSDIRNILYGHHFEDEETEKEYIQLFYNTVLYYRQYGFTRSDIVPFLWTKNIPEPLIGYDNIILDTMRQHSDFISCTLAFLYIYHQEVSQIFNVSHTRFDIYEKLLEMYGSIENAPFFLGTKEKELFKEHDSKRHMRMPADFSFFRPTVLVIRTHIFRHINYNSKENLQNTLFNEIKDILVSIYTRL